MHRAPTAASRITAALCTAAITTAALAQEDIGQVQITHNYSQDLNAEALSIPEQDRAWPLYRRAIMAQTERPDAFRGNTGLNWPARKGQPGWDESVAYVEANERAIALIHLAAKKPYMGYVATDIPDQILARHNAQQHDFEFKPETASENPPLFTILLPQLGSCRQMSRLLKQDLLIAVDRNEADRVVADLTTIHAIAQHVRQPPVMISELVGLAIDHLWRDEVLVILHTKPNLFQREHLLILRELVRTADHTQDMRDAFETERLAFLDAIQRGYTLNDDGDGYLTPRGYQLSHAGGMWIPSSKPGVGEFAGAMAARVAGASRKREIAANEKYLAMWKAMLEDLRPWDPESWESVIQAIRQINLAQARAVHPITSQHTGALDRAVTSTLRAQVQRSTLDLVLALELHHRQTGQYAASLEELVPVFLESIPIDPLDGNPIRYKLVDDKPVVYSVGANRADEGGIAAKDATPAQHSAWLNPIDVGRKWATGNNLPLPQGDWILYPIER